jgi:hypothetical protein
MDDERIMQLFQNKKNPVEEIFFHRFDYLLFCILSFLLFLIYKRILFNIFLLDKNVCWIINFFI